MDINKIDFSKISILEVIMNIIKNMRIDFSVEKILLKLNKKLLEAQLLIDTELNEKRKLMILLDLFYRKWNFGASNFKYKVSDMLWMDTVINTHQGTAISLGIIFLYFASKLNISIVPVIFPTQLILKFIFIKIKDFFIDPFNGDCIDENMLSLWLQGNISPATKMCEDYLKETPPLKVVQKFLDMLKIALVEEKCLELALRVNSVLLEISPKDPYEIRDRGLILAQLNCYSAAVADLLYFSDRCPEDPISEIIKMQIHTIKQKKNVLH